ncbi:hypothetical protein VLK81_06705 [Citroniella saccharovorans]|uniref:Uncharacterized protein n=1 Tax=Citroniella saccharovorans TaxID=2053367 RepID=A0AAW9MZ08_9FIRM|nr:hypothetical protein [Citroniella saccharovorans]MEB3429704.1 hypothetical protein [Citroniella saccharovorans]
MIIKVIIGFKDKERKGKLVYAGSLLDYEDEDRAKELVSAGVAVIPVIEEVKKVEETPKK